MTTSISCSIILPCYNPQDRWAENVVDNYRSIATHIEGDVEVVLINDGSLDGLVPDDIVYLKEELPHFQYLSYNNNKGKGYALREGVKTALGDVFVYTDVDFPYNTESFLQVYNALSKGVDVAAGVKNDEYYDKVPQVRRVISKLLRTMTKTFFRLAISDTQCGLKGFNLKGRSVFLKTSIDRYLFDLEFIMIAGRKKLDIQPVKVQLKDTTEFRTLNYKQLLPEVYNFMKLLFRSND